MECSSDNSPVKTISVQSALSEGVDASYISAFIPSAVEYQSDIPARVHEYQVTPGKVCHVPVKLPIEYSRKYIAGDNLDLLITPHYLSSERQRQSLHWFIEVEIEKRITASRDSVQSPQCHLKDVSCSKWLPTESECSVFEHNLNYHILRMLLKFTFLESFKDLVPEHIAHPYMESTKQNTTYRVVNVINANENDSEGIIEIMKDLHNTYVPRKNGDILHTTELAGDVLTNERAFGAQMNMMNASNSFDRLSGFSHRPGGLHLQMALTMVTIT